MHWSFCQQDENCIALNYRIVPFFGVRRWPYRYKDLQRKRELRRVRRKYIYIYIYISVEIVDVLPGCFSNILLNFCKN